ncbi:hypothetical protein D3C80_1001880 [compost metagenome]
MLTRKLTGGEHRFTPVALSNIQPHGACRVRHIAGKVTGHTKTQIIFWQKHFCDLTENLRLMTLHPQQFWRSEARHHQVAGDLARSRHAFFENGALFSAATVVPQNRRAQNAMLFIQQRRAVHLPGNAQRFHVP